MNKPVKNYYNRTIWTFNVKPTKRYRLIFSIWGHHMANSLSDFDTLDELMEEIKLLKSFYGTTPRPEKIYPPKQHRWDKPEPKISYENGGCYWGYIALDYKDEKIIEIYNDGCRVVCDGQRFINKKEDRKRILDIFFRKEDEVPEDYIWDEGEYEGWLRYRWGDGKNAIGYVETKKDKPLEISDDSSYDNSEDDYDYSEYEILEETIEDKLSEENKKRLWEKYGW